MKAVFWNWYHIVKISAAVQCTDIRVLTLKEVLKFSNLHINKKLCWIFFMRFLSEELEKCLSRLNDSESDLFTESFKISDNCLLLYCVITEFSVMTDSDLSVNKV